MPRIAKLKTRFVKDSRTNYDVVNDNSIQLSLESNEIALIWNCKIAFNDKNS